MIEQSTNWTSNALYLFGLWLWKEKEYGHSLLCLHGTQWGLKIGIQLSITWEDVIHTEDGHCKHELWLPKKEQEEALRPINKSIQDSLEYAYAKLPIKNTDDSIYLNYRTGKPLTSSTLNRELLRHSHQFALEIKKKTGVNLTFKELKSNAFEIAWAMDMVKKYNYSKHVFTAVSSFMGHRTVKDTIKLLELEPIDKIEFDFNNIWQIAEFKDFDTIDLEKDLSKYIGTHIVTNDKGEITKIVS